VAERNWHPIEAAPNGIGPLLLRSGSSSLDPVYVGYRSESGRWFSGDTEVRPTHYCEIPLFDADDDGAAA
jgi:hypothetical protein